MASPFELNLRHLRAVAAIEAGGSLSAAAEAVSLSQPALTQGLARLEAQIGAALFERRPDGMRATAAGARAAPKRLPNSRRRCGGPRARAGSRCRSGC